MESLCKFSLECFKCSFSGYLSFSTAQKSYSLTYWLFLYKLSVIRIFAQVRTIILFIWLSVPEDGSCWIPLRKAKIPVRIYPRTLSL